MNVSKNSSWTSLKYRIRATKTSTVPPNNGPSQIFLKFFSQVLKPDVIIQFSLREKMK